MAEPTCADYRNDMILLALRRRVEDETLPPAERQRLLEEIVELEAAAGIR